MFINGAVASPALSTTLASPAAALAYALSNWSAYGTWTLVDGNTLVLTSTTTTCLNAFVELQAEAYCLAPTFPVTFDTVKRSGDNGAVDTFTLPVAITASDNVALKAALTSPIDYFADGALGTTVTGKLDYLGTGVPIEIKLGAVSKGTWSAGACS